MTKHNKLIPSLRYRDFDQMWTVKSLDDIVEVIDCKHRTPEYVQEGIPVVSPGSIKWGEIDLITPTKRVVEEDYISLMDHCIPKIGDLVFSRNQSIGVASVLFKNEKFVLGQDTVLIQAKQIHPIFNYYRLQTDSVQRQISKLSGGSTFARINLKDLRKLKVTIIDDKVEQHKIASFLSAIDQKIQQLTRKKELLEQYKKGVMQQLFSGKLRFKDEKGKPYPRWEEKGLGDLCAIARSGGTPTSTKREFYDGEIPFLSISDMTSQGKYVNYTKNHISKLGLENSTSWIIPVNTIIYSMYASVGFVAINKIPIATSQAVLNLILKENIDIEFIYYSLVNFQRKVPRYITTGTQGNLNAQTVKGFKLSIPNLEEQQKIAACLCAIDTKTESITTQIGQIQMFKKGLLQQMFV